jgi:multiple antibiotic resistance protein
MLTAIIGFLIMLNPFALFLYLEPVRKDLDFNSFLKVIFKATIISFTICLIFFLFGDFIIHDLFQISFESFRIFGGIVIFSYAYYFIVKGQKALILIKEDLDDLASEIALPFMIGGGTISLSILLSENFIYWEGLLALIIIFTINLLAIISLVKIRNLIDKKKFKIAFDKNMEVLLRLNGFFIGAIGINMIVLGILNLFF